MPYKPRNFAPWLLIWKYLGSRWDVALVPSGGWIPDQTTYYIGMDDFPLAFRYYAWFHSELAQDTLLALAERGKDHCFFYYAHTVYHLPIPPDLATQEMEIPQPRSFYPGQGAGLWK